MTLVWKANTPIYWPSQSAGPLAYAEGDVVPDANVAAYGYDTKGVVTQVDVTVTVPGSGGAAHLTVDQWTGGKAEQPLTPADYLCVGDGVTNDTTNLQTAVAAAAGRSLYISRTHLTTDAISVPSNTRIFGPGTIKSVTLVSGGSTVGHRQLHLNSVSGVRIEGITLDTSTMSTFTAGMRSILAQSSSDYRIVGCKFKTPGAATASIGCSDYWVLDNRVEFVTADGTAHHDGIIDQWDGSSRFTIRGNRIDGASIGKYGILVTGLSTALAASPCSEFTITGNRVRNVTQVGIWSQGGSGVNSDFVISDNVVTNVTVFHGIGAADSKQFQVIGNVINGTASNGIRLWSDPSSSGTTGAQGGVVTGNIVTGANTLASAGQAGAAINVQDNSGSISIGPNRVKGTAHTYAVYFGASTTKCERIGANYDAGTSGTFNNDPSAGTYTPTLTSVANVSASTPRACRWSRVADQVTVTGRVEVTPTAAASTATQLGISLPVASNLGSVNTDMAGTANSQFAVIGAIAADATNDRAQLQFPATNTSSNVFYFTFQYAVI